MPDSQLYSLTSFVRSCIDVYINDFWKLIIFNCCFSTKMICALRICTAGKHVGIIRIKRELIAGHLKLRFQYLYKLRTEHFLKRLLSCVASKNELNKNKFRNFICFFSNAKCYSILKKGQGCLVYNINVSNKKRVIILFYFRIYCNPSWSRSHFPGSEQLSFHIYYHSSSRTWSHLSR